MLYPLLPLSDPEHKTVCTAAPFRNFSALFPGHAVPAAAPPSPPPPPPPPRCYRAISPEPCYHRAFYAEGHMERMVRPCPPYLSRSKRA